VLAPFQRGYTPTSRPKRIADYRLQELCQDILHLMDTAGLGRAHIVGHDWGGGVAWFLADRYPERVSSLTVVSTPHPRALSRTLLTSRQLLLSWYLIFFQIPGFPEWILTRNRGWLGQKWLANLGLDATRATRYARKFANDPALLTGALNWYRALLFDAPYGFTASAVLPPTLYVWGTADSTVSGKAAQLTGQWVENSYSFCPLEGASHWIPEQLPRKLAKMITEHARKFPA
jgi:pimeloyl-ACP methyl ester carboxylesterase